MAKFDFVSSSLPIGQESEGIPTPPLLNCSPVKADSNFLAIFFTKSMFHVHGRPTISTLGFFFDSFLWGSFSWIVSFYILYYSFVETIGKTTLSR